MIKQFQFSRIPDIRFGQGEIKRLPEIARLFGRRIIIVTGKKSFTDSSGFAVLVNALKPAGLEFRTITIPGEPSPGMIDKAVSELRSFGADVIVAVGGGSVIDAGKAISAMLTVNGSITEYLEDVGEREHPGTKIPFIAVPTTSGTGSEATKNAVISRTGRNGFKKSLRHNNFVPDIALIDPELTIDCPPEITAASGMDCFSQLTESWLSTKANEYTDALSLEGLKAVRTSLLKSYSDRHNIEARTGMAFAALTSGICLANAGLGTVHGFASSIGGLYHIPHGVVCGTLMAVTNEVNVRTLRASGMNPSALKKYSILGRLFIDDPGKPDDYYINGFISWLHELTEILNLQKLGKFGVSLQDIDRICQSTGNKNNPILLGKEEFAEIVTTRL